jgi:Tfp pilus assembly protein PilN
MISPWLLVLLALIGIAQFVLFWLYVREGQRQSASERDKLLDRIQTGSAERAGLLERTRETPPAPRKTVVNIGGIEGVELTGERG